MIGPQFSWAEAVTVMKNGGVVRRASEMYNRPANIEGDDGEEIQITESGVEAMRLVTAVAVDGSFVQVFQGVESKCLFEPGEIDMAATDWVSVTHDRSLW